MFGHKNEEIKKKRKKKQEEKKIASKRVHQCALTHSRQNKAKRTHKNSRNKLTPKRNLIIIYILYININIKNNY